MATGETGFAGVTSDPISVQHHSATTGRDGAPCARDATVQQPEVVASAPCDEGLGGTEFVSA